METKVRDPYDDIEERLAKLRRLPPVDQQRFLDGRARFLLQARQMKAQSDHRPANAHLEGVSSRPGQRLIGWILELKSLPIGNLLRAKERPAMFAPVMTALVVIVLLFGGAGATAYAAQDSLPADALYPVKTLTEDVQLGLSARDQNRLDLELTFAERRVGEMAALARLGLDTPPGVANRMGARVEEALTIASGLAGEAQQEALGQILTRMQIQEQVMAGLEASRPEDAILTQARQRLQEQLRLAGQGLSDPAGLQNQLRQRARIHAWEVQGPGGPGWGQENGNDNGNGNGNGSGFGNSNANGNANGNAGPNANGNGNGSCGGANCNANENGGNGPNGNDANGNGGNGNANMNGNGGYHGGDSDDNGNDNGGYHGGDGDDANENGGYHGGNDHDDGGDNGGYHGGDDNDDNGGAGGNDGGHHGGDGGGNDNDNGGSGGHGNGGGRN